MPVFGNNIQSPYDMSNPQEPKKKKTGTGFTNLQTMLNKNSGSELGQTIGNGISGAASDVKSKLSDEQAQYGQQLGQAQSQFDPNKRDELINQAGTSGQPNDETTKTFEKYRNGDLGAPDLSNGLTGYGNLSSKAADVAQQGKDVESQAGRYNLLQRYASGGKQYTAGQKRLDSMLLGRNGSDELQQARLATGGIGTQLQQAQQGAQAQYGQAVGNVKQFGLDTQNKLSSAESDLSNNVDFAAKKAAADKQYSDIMGGLGTRPDSAAEELNPGSQAKYDEQRRLTAQSLGISPDQNMYGMTDTELGNLVKYDRNKTSNASQFATPDQNARMAALAKLSGQSMAIDPKTGQAWGSGVGGEANGALNVAKNTLRDQLAAKEAGIGDATSAERAGSSQTRDWMNNTNSEIMNNRDKNIEEINNRYGGIPSKMVTDEYGNVTINPAFTQYQAEIQNAQNSGRSAYGLTQEQAEAQNKEQQDLWQKRLAAKEAAYRGNKFLS